MKTTDASADFLRLLVVTSSFHPTTGGAETYAFEIAQSFAARGHAISVVTDVPRMLAADQGVFGDPPDVIVHRLSGYRQRLDDESKVPWEELYFGLLPELQEIVRQFRPNMLLSNSLDTAVIAKIIQLELQVPWVAAFHEQTPETEPLGTGRIRLVYEVLRPDLVLAGSEFYAERARRWGCGDRLVRIYHGVNTDEFHPAVDGRATRIRYGISNEELLIVCAGRLKERKGMRELICAFRQIAPKLPMTRLLIVGSVNSASRKYADQLRDDAKRFGLESVILFDETVTFDAMPSVLAAADIVVQPSLAEGLCLSVIEAMAVGKPVITTDIPGVREITNGTNAAIVVPPGDVSALAAALAVLLSEKGLRLQLGVRGRGHVELYFSHTAMIQHTENALAGLLRQHTVNI
jgi:glycosyltransferase involved in cell wall biosynthesis